MRLRKRTFLLTLVVVLVLLASSAGFAYQKDVLRIGIPSLPSELDGHVIMGNDGQRVLFNIFEKLVHFDKEDPSVITPQLAESWVWINDTTVEFKLREGVLFHNGQPLTARDFKYSLERIKNPVTGSGAFYTMLLTIESIEVIDDLTLRLVTSEPDPILETRLASLWGGFVIPEGYVEEVGEETYILNPVSTGPYMVKSYEPDRIVLTAFEDYWGVKPNVKELVYIEIPELAARMTALINGEVDLISTIAPDQVPFLERYDYITVLNKPIANMHVLTFNITQPPTDDKLLRQAMALSIDRQTIVDAIFSGGTEVPRSYQFNEYGSMINQDIPRNPYDPEKAKELLAASGYNGETLYYDGVANYYTGTNEAAEIIVEMWRQIGINVQIRFSESAWQNPDFNIHTWSNTMRFPDFSAQSLQWGVGTTRQNGTEITQTWPESELRTRYNELQGQLETTMDQAKRYEIYQEMLDVWREEVPATELWFAPESWAMRSDIVWDPYYAHIMDFGGHNLSFK